VVEIAAMESLRMLTTRRRSGRSPLAPRAQRRRAARCWRTAVFLLLVGTTIWSACDKQSAELRARQAAEKMKESLPDVDGKALTQKLPAEEVRQMQQGLAAVHEYQGDVNGELDQVTVNALQAFQRAHGLRDDGVWSDATKRRLQEAAQEATAKTAPRGS
jgi:putative peptidoglycan binding protein